MENIKVVLEKQKKKSQTINLKKKKKVDYVLALKQRPLSKQI